MLDIKLVKQYWHTLRYLRWVQFYKRLLFLCYTPSVSKYAAQVTCRSTVNWVQPASHSSNLVGPTKFRIFGVCGDINEIGWVGSHRNKLWRYNQHYFDELSSRDNHRRDIWHKDLIRRWIADNPPFNGDGWEPYPTSLRIVNWIKWSLDSPYISDRFNASLVIQSRWLSKRLEYHLLGNHLFANAKALVFAGCFFKSEEAESWLFNGLRILSKEIPEQILADGGQFERSPMYHALAVEDMLDLLNILRVAGASKNEYSNSLSKRIRFVHDEILLRLPDMLRWMMLMQHPDQRIAFFNDSAFDIAPSADELIGYAARLGVKLVPVERNAAIFLSSSGYIRLANDQTYILFDAAPIGPDYLPGHAHADTLSIELSLFGQRVFVNSGTSEYGSGAERHRQRSTAAHNTVEINGENSSEVWSGFRVARRAYPFKQSVINSCDRQQATAWHNGYHRLRPPVSVGRTVSLMSGSLAIEDLIEGTFYSAVSRFYCHPEVQAELVADKLILLRLKNGQVVHLIVEGSAQLAIEASTWHPKFGVVEQNQCIVIVFATNRLLTRLEWSLS